MRENDKIKLEVSLIKAIEAWWDEQETVTPGFLVGDNVFPIMARAAMTVLEGIHDSQEYLRGEGMLED